MGPQSLGGLANLRVLSLYSNAPGGTIPPELGNLVNATRFELDANNLGGPLPPELMNIPGTSGSGLESNGCFTASGGAFLSWLTLMDPLWDNGC